MRWGSEARDEGPRGWKARGQRQNIRESFGRLIRKRPVETLHVYRRQGTGDGFEAGDPDYPSRRQRLREEGHKLVCKEVMAEDIGAEDFS